MSKQKRKKKMSQVDHSQCECWIQQRGPHWGLFCQQHNHWLKWLSAPELAQLRQMDIPMIVNAK